MTFEHPASLLLLVPVLVGLWWRGLGRGVGAGLRVGAAAAICVALATPQCPSADGGRDFVVVVDRSGSMPAAAEERTLELLESVEKERRSGDRVGVVAVGREARIETLPAGAPFHGLTQSVTDDATDLGAALGLASQLVPEARRGRVLVISDGLDTQGTAMAAGQQLAAREIPIDFVRVSRPGGAVDVAVLGLDVPVEVSSGEPVQIAAQVQSVTAIDADVVLRRDGIVVAARRTRLVEGRQQLLFRDRVGDPGVARYSLEIKAIGDVFPENNRGLGAVRVAGPPRILVIRSDSRRSAVAEALAESKLEVEVRASPPLTLAGYEGVRLVVLENVPASNLGDDGLRALARFVDDAGGSLLMTGGRRSLGEGGYIGSAVEPLLPVTLEIRDEQRKTSITLGIALDRSGSMSMTTPEGVTKMKLAAEGAVAALKLLGPNDEAAVWAVDTQAHEVLPLSSVSKGLPLGLVASMQSEGGGIYIGNALEAAADALRRSAKATRHLILFADAADSEEPGDYRRILADLRKRQITVSVIGMGTRADPDAKLLEEIAKLGEGRIYFSERASELPRLFSEETVVLAKSSFVSDPVAVVVTPDAAQLGLAGVAPPVSIGGYNVTWPRSRASVAMRTEDENHAPIVAFWRAGAGRVATIAAEADGEFTGELRRWPGYRALLTGLSRFLLPPMKQGGSEARARLSGDAVVVKVDAGIAGLDASRLQLVVVDDTGREVGRTAVFERDDEGLFVARVPVSATGLYFPIVKAGEEVLRAAPVASAFAPELAPRDPAEGKALLEELSRVTGGVERLSVERLFDDGGVAPARADATGWFVLGALLLLLGEVVWRRLGLSVPALALPRVSVAALTPPPAAPPPPSPGGTTSRALEKAREKARNRLR